MIQKTHNLVTKYKNMAIPIKAAFWFTICSFLQRGITMITTPIFTRVLPEEQYGIISTYSAWQSVLTLVITLSLYKGMMNLFVKRENKEEVLSAVCGMSIVVCGIWYLVYFVIRNQIAHLLGMSNILVVCLLTSILYQAIYNNWSLYERYCYNYTKIVLISLISSFFVSFVAIACVLLIGPTAENRIVPQTISNLLILIYLLVLVFKKNKTFYDKESWRFSLSFCVVLLPHYLSEFILQSSDKLMINYMCGLRDVALYSVAYSAGSLINLITNAINSSFAPYQYQQIEAEKYEELAKRANQVLLVVACILGAVMFFSKEIVLVFGGYKYVESSEVIIPISIGIYFNYLFQLFARVQEYYEKKITVIIPSILCAVLNIVLNYIFIKIYGYKAAAYTTVVCYMLFCFLHFVFYKKVCREILNGTNLYDIKGLTLISLGVIICGMIIMLINTMSIVKYSLSAAVVILILIQRKTVVKFLKSIYAST